MNSSKLPCLALAFGSVSSGLLIAGPIHDSAKNGGFAVGCK